jgi:hypothetical protein
MALAARASKALLARCTPTIFLTMIDNETYEIKNILWSRFSCRSRSAQ